MASSCSSGVKEESDVGNLSNGTDGTLSNSFVEEIQGYDVEFDPPLKSKYECPICVMALREAVQTRCGHHFCKACIVKSIRSDCVIMTPMISSSVAAETDEGLKAPTVLFGEPELHWKKDHQLHCGFASEECSQCQGCFQKKQLQEHIMLECPRRQVTCPNCIMSMAYEDKECTVTEKIHPATEKPLEFQHPVGARKQRNSLLEGCQLEVKSREFGEA
ncbi:TNF receptor-associated factor 6-like [Sphaerodactylus townsendi]|uniref:TNF receptor-associated factor 6-like n=1 Tax=Sphaerodactylus townsendi TaxID=933632 RepID=UPI0020264D89|nr:TNF receptor-associated factor 6-like [Sphaerodactylus townsendi]